MVLYFVCKLKLISNKPSKKKINKNKVSLLCFSNNDEDAWEMVKVEAHAYKTKKNDKLCDQTSDTESTIVKELYKIRTPNKKEDKIHTIEVIKQWREKGWISTEYKELKIAEFSMIKFEGNIGYGINTDIVPDLNAIANVIGGSHPQLLKDLRNSDLFRERIRQVDKYSRYSHDEITESVETEE